MRKIEKGVYISVCSSISRFFSFDLPRMKRPVKRLDF